MESSEHKINTIIKFIGTDGLSGDLDKSLSQAVMDIAMLFAINGYDITEDQLQIFIDIFEQSDRCSLHQYLKIDLGY